MKIGLILGVLLLCASALWASSQNFVGGGANTSLSNLSSPTSINQILLPASDTAIGSSSHPFGQVWTDSGIYCPFNTLYLSPGINVDYNNKVITSVNEIQVDQQASGNTPTCGSGQSAYVALTHSFILCVCNGSGWVKVADGSTSCTF